MKKKQEEIFRKIKDLIRLAMDNADEYDKTYI